MDGKFMVLSRDRSAEVFDPTASTWRRWEDMISFRVDLWRSFAVACSSSGELYAFSERQQQVMKYDGGKHVWTVVASLPRHIYLFKCATQLVTSYLVFLGVGHDNMFASRLYLH
jgi:hypothetical protein